MNQGRDQQDYLESAPAEDQQVRFVSRSAPTTPASPGVGAHGHGLPRLLERSTLLLLLITAALQAFSWSQLEGYQLADSVEYMERAWAFVRGEQLQSTGAVRSLGFSSLLVPFFGIAELLDLRDLRPIVHVVRLFQMALGLGLVFLCMRIGARLGGRMAGFAAGALCAINPAFLQYSVSPVSGIAAALFIAIGLNAVIDRGTSKRALLGGLAFGAAFLMAYQTILITGAILGMLLLRDRRAHFAHVARVAGGFSIGILAQVVLDKISYGVWGVSIGNYLIENVGGVVLSTLYNLGFTEQQWVKDLYASYVALLEGSVQAVEGDESGALQSNAWYFSELHTMLVYPVMALGVLGLLRSWLQMNWRSSILLGSLGLCVVVMSMKGSKSFRLWLPLLPMIAPLCGWGLGLITDAGTSSLRLARRAVAALILLASAGLGIQTLLEVNTRSYGVYWEAMEFVNDAVATERAETLAAGEDWSNVRVCSAYHWAVFGRGSDHMKVAKLSEHLDGWGELEEEQRRQVMHELVTSHWLIIHDALLSLHADLTTELNDHFEVATTFWDEDADRGLRDVLVLRNISREDAAPLPWSGARPRRFWELTEQQDPKAYRRQLGLDRALPLPQLFVGQAPSGAPEHLSLLGWSYERLPDSDFGWITYHWWSETGFERDYTLIDRLTVPGMHSWWRNDHQPGRGFFPTSQWPAGSIVREGFVVLPGEDLFKDEFNPIGGGYRRGDLIPATLWFKCREALPQAEGEEALAGDEAPSAEAALLHPVARGSSTPLVFAEAPGLPDDVFESSDGHLAMRDGLVRIGELFLPVGARFKVPDDGQPVED